MEKKSLYCTNDKIKKNKDFNNFLAKYKKCIDISLNKYNLKYDEELSLIYSIYKKKEND